MEELSGTDPAGVLEYLKDDWTGMLSNTGFVMLITLRKKFAEIQVFQSSECNF